MGAVLMEGLEPSRRVTSASLYLVDADARALELIAQLGPESARASTSPRCARCSTTRRARRAVRSSSPASRRPPRARRDARGRASSPRVRPTMESLSGSVALPLLSESGRPPGAAHRRRRPGARRLLPDECKSSGPRRAGRHRGGELAAPRAHQGARPPRGDGRDGRGARPRDSQSPRGIKGAAQFHRGHGPRASDAAEFIGIIVEEVGRLDRVVSSFLDYARPYRGNPSLLDDVNVVERTLQLVRADLPAESPHPRAPRRRCPRCAWTRSTSARCC
jgi:two-component system sensor histidine kinase HydH